MQTSHFETSERAILFLLGASRLCATWFDMKLSAAFRAGLRWTVCIEKDEKEMEDFWRLW